jgi:hypothetical protein
MRGELPHGPRHVTTAVHTAYYKLAIPMLAMLGQDFAKGYGAPTKLRT